MKKQYIKTNFPKEFNDFDAFDSFEGAIENLQTAIDNFENGCFNELGLMAMEEAQVMLNDSLTYSQDRKDELELTEQDRYEQFIDFRIEQEDEL